MRRSSVAPCETPVCGSMRGDGNPTDLVAIRHNHRQESPVWMNSVRESEAKSLLDNVNKPSTAFVNACKRWASDASFSATWNKQWPTRMASPRRKQPSFYTGELCAISCPVCLPASCMAAPSFAYSCSRIVTNRHQLCTVAVSLRSIPHHSA